jgi:hypothetical protein
MRAGEAEVGGVGRGSKLGAEPFAERNLLMVHVIEDDITCAPELCHMTAHGVLVARMASSGQCELELRPRNEPQRKMGLRRKGARDATPTTTGDDSDETEGSTHPLSRWAVGTRPVGLPFTAASVAVMAPSGGRNADSLTRKCPGHPGTRERHFNPGANRQIRLHDAGERGKSRPRLRRFRSTLDWEMKHLLGSDQLGMQTARRWISWALTETRPLAAHVGGDFSPLSGI